MFREKTSLNFFQPTGFLKSERPLYVGNGTLLLPSIQQKNRRSKANNGRGKQGKGRRRGRGGRGDEDEDDDEEQEMEVGTRHEEFVYWYTRFEDPNCIAVVELVATIMDTVNGIQVRSSVRKNAKSVGPCMPDHPQSEETLAIPENDF